MRQARVEAMSNEMIRVPRNKLKALIAQCLDEAGGNPDLILEELRALLAKPAEQQGEPVACMPVERCYDVRAKMIIAFNEAKKAGGDLDDALDAAYKSALRYSPNPMSAEQPAPAAVVLPVDWQDQLFAEMDRRFELRKLDEDHMANDDTQIGVEFAMKWITDRLDEVARLNPPQQ